MLQNIRKVGSGPCHTGQIQAATADEDTLGYSFAAETEETTVRYWCTSTHRAFSAAHFFCLFLSVYYNFLK
jgi:hypothetical protein